jgi:hypothetical protein
VQPLESFRDQTPTAASRNKRVFGPIRIADQVRLALRIAEVIIESTAAGFLTI